MYQCWYITFKKHITKITKITKQEIWGSKVGVIRQWPPRSLKGGANGGFATRVITIALRLNGSADGGLATKIGFLPPPPLCHILNTPLTMKTDFFNRPELVPRVSLTRPMTELTMTVSGF